MYLVSKRFTREDGRPQADLVGPDHAFVRVIGPEAHALAQGSYVALSFVSVEAPPPVPTTPTIPLVQMRLGGTVTPPKKEK